MTNKLKVYVLENGTVIWAMQDFKSFKLEFFCHPNAAPIPIPISLLILLTQYCHWYWFDMNPNPYPTSKIGLKYQNKLLHCARLRQLFKYFINNFLFIV